VDCGESEFDVEKAMHACIT